jgi:hypothetical protein
MRQTPAMEISHDTTASGEEWVTGQGDDARMVDVLRTHQGFWSVSLAAAEFVRTEPLESRMREAVAAAIEAVPGVTEAWEEDREVWSVDGDPSGEALLRAVAVALEPLADDITAHIAGLHDR